MSERHWPLVADGRPTGTRITDVIDGDTVDALVVERTALSFGLEAEHRHRVRLRLDGINAPKLGSAAGARARDHLADLAADEPIVELVTLKPYKFGGPSGDYRGAAPGPVGYAGEFMVRVVLADGSTLSGVMVADGHAVWWDGRGARPGDE